MDNLRKNKIYSEDGAKRIVANLVADFNIENMEVSEAEQKNMLNFLTGKITKEEFNKEHFAL